MKCNHADDFSRCECECCLDPDNQEHQAVLLIGGATYTEPDELAKLRDLFGGPDENGVYGAAGR
jgi:hypothetical protein